MSIILLYWKKCLHHDHMIEQVTVSLYKVEVKQKPRTKLSMYPINIHIGEPKTAFTKILAAYGFFKIGFKVLKQL